MKPELRTHDFKIAAITAALIFTALAGAACSRAESRPQPAAPPAPPVTVATAGAGNVTDWDEYTGRFEAVQHVDLRPRVSGYIDEVRYVEGREVGKGDVLFLIDPRPYRAALRRAEGELARVRAQRELAQSESVRAEKLLASRAISQEEHDQRSSRQSQAVAELASAQAAVDAAKLDLEFTRVTAPIAGRVSRTDFTAGNYVTAGQSVLTSLVSVDPIYVSFDGDEQSYLRYRARQSGEAVSVGLANEDGYPHQGQLNFLDNALDPATGTIRVRAQLSNAERRFTPGLLARVRLPGGAAYPATLVPDVAVGTDQDRRYVLVVAQDGTVEYRPVQLGAIQDGQRVVRDGLKPGERVIVSGLARARPGTRVTPQDAAAPKVAQAAP